MNSIGTLSLLRAARTHSHYFPTLRYPLQPSCTTTQISSCPFHHVNQGRKSFHWQSAIGTAIEGTQSLLVHLHTATSLPWFLTIPLVAFTVGAVFRLPFSVYTQRILQRRTQCNPLLQAWNSRIQLDVQRERIPAQRRWPEIKKRQDQALRRMYRKLGLQDWRLWSSILSFPFWLIAIDAVRRLCGGPRGLLGSLITGSATPAEGTRATGADAATTASPLPDLMADPSILATEPAPASFVAETAAVVDPSLSFEGCLWFTDLTASDPHHILPLALSCTLVWNLIPKSDAPFSDRVRMALGRRPMGTPEQMMAGLGRGWRSKLSQFMMALAILVGPLTLDLPAALHLYWLTSSATNALFMGVLRRLVPINGALRKRCMGAEVPVIRPRRRGGLGSWMGYSASQ
ncbi:hypothetical protein F5B18DRAFT_231342 [Nemania serpens]|nr:hypothetical protein F5B18DRAFT_231342 [Nemania serpens]